MSKRRPIFHLHNSSDIKGNEYIFDVARRLNEKGYFCRLMLPWFKAENHPAHIMNTPVIYFGSCCYWDLIQNILICFVSNFSKTTRLFLRWFSGRFDITILSACLWVIRHDAVLIHAQRAATFSTAMKISILCDIPWLMHIRGHDVRVRPLSEARWRGDLPILLGHSSGILAPCQSLIDIASEYAEIRGKAWVIHKGFALKQTVLPKKLSEDSKIVVATVGRLVWEKGYSYALDGLAALRKKGIKNWKYLIIGSGIDNQALHYQVKQLGLEDCIEFIPMVDPDQVLKHLGDADIYLQPSVSEGIPSSLCEAMLMGVPCIVTSIGGMPELITHQQDGWIIAPRSPQMLAEAVALLISNPDLRRKLAENGMKTITHYTLEREVFEILEVYKKILKK